MKNILLLMMGGSGTRFGADIPKQYVEIDGVPVFAYILEKYSKMKEIDEVVAVSHRDWTGFVREWASKLEIYAKLHIVTGGDTRSASVLNGLVEASAFADDKDVVLIHDATHPYVDVQGTIDVIKAARECGGATLAQYQYDTVYRKNANDMLEEVIPREVVAAGASPEAFLFGDIYRIYRDTPEEQFEIMTSAEAIALANDIKMKVIKANIINLKITYQEDMEIFKKLAKTYFFED